MKMKKTTLPEGLALVETANGRWFPAFAPLIEAPGWATLLGDSGIPLALEPLHDPRKGYLCRQEAIEACYAWHEEAAILPLHWQTLATATEIYPERNAWYGEEIQHLLGERSTFTITSVGNKALAVVIATRDGIEHIVDAMGANPDEAMEALYQRVYAFMSAEEYRALPYAS